MNKTVEQLKKKIIPILKEAGVTRSSLFGSVARGEMSATSDIDVLVEFNPPRSMFYITGLQQKLEKELGRKVDLLTYDAIHRLLRDIIKKEEVVILQ